MSIKRFCDCCEQEIVAGRSISGSNGRLQGIWQPNINRPRLTVEVTTGTNGAANVGDWCRFCIIDAVKSLDTREKQQKIPGPGPDLEAMHYDPKN